MGGFELILDEAQSAGKIIQAKYWGGSSPGQVRELVVISQDAKYVQAREAKVRQGSTKTFTISKIEWAQLENGPKALNDKFVKNIRNGFPCSESLPKFGLDENGQPVSLALNQGHRLRRSVDELIGLCKGMAADEVVNQAEAEALLKWLEANRETTYAWPGNVLIDRVSKALTDGILDGPEATELLETLESIGRIAPGHAPGNLSATLPIDKPEPEIIFEKHAFCFTGKFVTGTRKDCQGLVLGLGGRVHKNPTMHTHYLVIGDLASRDWAHSSYGRKIEYAVKLRDEKDVNLAIVSEQYWYNTALEV